MENFAVRRAVPEDVPKIAAMCRELWPDASVEEHARNVLPVIEGKAPGILPDIIFVAQHVDGQVLGFVDVDLRSHADGCNPAHPVGYIEGWYVIPESRRTGVGARLIAAAESWARDQGCVEMASDTWLHNPKSQVAHEALGYQVVDRCVHYRKDIAL